MGKRVVGIALMLGMAMGMGCKKKAPVATETPVAPAAAVPAPAAAAQGGAVALTRPAPAGTLPEWKPVSETTSKMQIRVVPGMVQDSVILSKLGDVETLDTVLSVDGGVLTKDVGNEMLPADQVVHAEDPNVPTQIGHATWIVDLPDLQTSHKWMYFFNPGKTEHYPGSLDREVSAEVLQQLKAGQEVEFELQADVGRYMTALMSGHGKEQPSLVDWGKQTMNQCNLRRVEPTDLAFPVIVNDEAVELPVVHARCVLDNGEENDLYVLDQPSYPMIVWTYLGVAGDTSQTVKISYEVPDEDTKIAANGGLNVRNGGGLSMEQKLKQKEKVEVYGIYFDFNSAVIKPESEPVLKEIAGVMQQNPDWKLSVAGHTDNVGGDAFNQKLSEARAAAVKKALVTKYKVAAGRLVTSGFGASQPIADNAKVEGRARNRRVELQRQ